MQQEAHYAQVVTEVLGFLRARVAFAIDRGIAREQIAVDPGIGFGKTVEHNLRLLAHLDEFRSVGCPILVGASRKSFVGKVLAPLGAGQGREGGDRLWGSLAVAAWAVTHGAYIVRVHDVAETVEVMRMIEAVKQAT